MLSHFSPLKPRKAPSQMRAAQTVEAIVEAAAQILERDGIEGFNTNAVARRAGVSIGSLYQYFPGKDALTVALIRRETQRFYDDAAAALDRPGGKAALECLIRASVHQQLQRPVLARLLDREEARPGLYEEVSFVEPFQMLIATLIQRAVPALARPHIAAGDVLAMIRGMVDAAGERGERDIDDMVDRVGAAVFGYLSRISSR